MTRRVVPPGSGPEDAQPDIVEQAQGVIHRGFQGDFPGLDFVAAFGLTPEGQAAALIVEVVLFHDAFALADKRFPVEKRHQPPLPVDHLGLVALGQPAAGQLPHPLGCPKNLRPVTTRFQHFEHQVNPAHIRAGAQADLVLQVFPDHRRRCGRDLDGPRG